MMQIPDCINLRYILQKSGQSPETVEMLIKNFMDSFAKMIERMEYAAKKKDAKGFKNIVKELSFMASFVEAPYMNDLYRQMIKDLEAGSFQSELYIQIVKKIYNSIKKEMELDIYLQE